MANSIVGKPGPKKLRVRMSNGATNVVIGLLALSGSEKAERSSEKELALALCAKDQSIFGRGCISFDIRELPWSKKESEFRLDKEYFESIIGAAREGCFSDRLDYEPDLEFIAPCFEDLSQLVDELAYDDISEIVPDRELLVDAPYNKCEIHGCYNHLHGCVICNDR